MSNRGSNAGAFAAAIVRRYGEASLFAPMLDMTVRLTPHAAPTRISAFHTRVEIAPRLAVTVMNPLAPARVRDVRGPHASAVHADVVQRLVNRQRRSELDVGQAAADLHPARVSAAGRSPVGTPGTESARHIGASPVPLPMTLCRPAQSAPVEDSRERRQRSSASHISERSTSNRTRAAETSSTATPAAINVDQLTDKVMRALDRRIVAYRERTAGG